MTQAREMWIAQQDTSLDDRTVAISAGGLRQLLRDAMTFADQHREAGGDVGAIKARCEAATKGPWAFQLFGKEWCLTGQWGMRPIVLASRKNNLTSLINGLLRPLDPNHPDAVFIAHARTDIPVLLNLITTTPAPTPASEPLRVALESIANNTCCGSCQEAALVAQAALAGQGGHAMTQAREARRSARRAAEGTAPQDQAPSESVAPSPSAHPGL